MKVGLCQLNVTDNKKQNIERAKEQINIAGNKGAQLIILPEMFCICYVASLFLGASEECPGGEIYNMLSEQAKKNNAFIIGGSIPELENNNVYNTSLSFGPDGAFLGKYRKAHLFDVDVPGKFRFMESESITKGEGYPLIVDAPIKTGVSICFDIRFPEWIRIAMEKGADILALPAAFSRNTGPRHWELLLRARALDNQLFVAAVSPAESKSAYGHSMLVSPDGVVLFDCGTEEQVAVLDVDYSILEEMRCSIPVKNNRRKDMYRLEAIKQV